MNNFAEDVFTDVECIVPVRCEPVEELEVGSQQQRKAKKVNEPCAHRFNSGISKLGIQEVEKLIHPSSNFTQFSQSLLDPPQQEKQENMSKYNNKSL